MFLFLISKNGKEAILNLTNVHKLHPYIAAQI